MNVGLRAWLLTGDPSSRRQARLGQYYRTWLNFRVNGLAMAGLAIVAGLILVAVFAGVLTVYSPIAGGDLRTARLLPPSFEHWFGTDDQARDILSRVVHGSRLTLLVIALVAVIATPIGHHRPASAPSFTPPSPPDTTQTAATHP